MTIPVKYSPVYDALLKECVTNTPGPWGKIARGMLTRLALNERPKEIETAKVVALADASFLPRIVVKGPGTAAFLNSQNIAIPEGILKVAPLPGGGVIARTGGSEFFLEDGEGGVVVAGVEAALNTGGAPVMGGVYPVLRQDASFIISGSRAGELFRHVSSYDFISESHDDLVFTPIAGVSCSVLRTTLKAAHDRPPGYELPVFRLWTDGTYGLYIWHTLLEVAKELGGGAVGAAVFYSSLLTP